MSAHAVFRQTNAVQTSLSLHDFSVTPLIGYGFSAYGELDDTQ